jgi:multisubunit Na+/H+ antiporter MnhB subunit
MLVVATAILVRGYVAVGDGFSAGVIAALAFLLQYIVLDDEEIERVFPPDLLRRATTLGLLLMLIVTFAPLLFGYPLLSHFPAPGEHVTHIGALELHTAVLFDVGVFLLVFGFIVSTARTLARVARSRQR